MRARHRLRLTFNAPLHSMFIRKSPIKSKKSGGDYFSYRLVESVRENGKVKQKTLLNLGKNFDVDPALWATLAQRIDFIVQGKERDQQNLFDLDNVLDIELEATAQRLAALVLQKLSAPVITGDSINQALRPNTDYQSLDVNQIKVLKPRSIGAETLAVQAFKQLQLDDKLRELGFNEKDLSAAVGSIVGRMVHPASERETHRWLQNNSALGELIGHDYDKTSLDRLYKVADKLLSNKGAIETHLNNQEQELFNLPRTIILYDLTNTFFEGTAAANAKAAKGRSKEKRSDCPLVTMGLVLDGHGFPIGSEIFEGNASEPKTLKTMIEGLGHSSSYQGSTIVLDAGISSQENLEWLKENNYHYIVVSREKYKEKPDVDQGAVIVKPVQNDQVIAKRVEDPKTGEIRLYCHSQKREAKENAILTQFHLRYEAALSSLHNGLSKKGTIKKYDKILERLGKLKGKYSRVAHCYDITVHANEDKTHATHITWKRNTRSEQKDVNAGVYCLRSDVKTLSEKELWQTYVMLTEVEASFRSMKSELGLRPIYHQKEERVTAHLFITLLAYHLVHTLRVQLKDKSVDLSWQSIREIMTSQQRVTISAPTQNQQQLFVRTTTQAEPVHQVLYDALGLEADGLGARKTVIEKG